MSYATTPDSLQANDLETSLFGPPNGDASAKFAAACHVKTFEFDAAGNETSGANPEEAIGMLLDSGYKGVWGVESVPKDGDEYAGARRTVDLIRRTVS